MIKIQGATQIVHHSYPVDPNAYFEPGMLAEINRIGQATVSAGQNPCGIFDDFQTIYNNTTAALGRVNVIDTMNISLTTDQFEADILSANIGCDLYCSTNGKWTSISANNSRIGFLDYVYFSSFPVIISVVYYPFSIGAVKAQPTTPASTNGGSTKISNAAPFSAASNTTFISTSSFIPVTTISIPINIVSSERKPALQKEVKYGAICCECKNYFPYAEQIETFKCYSCRMVW